MAGTLVTFTTSAEPRKAFAERQLEDATRAGCDSYSGTFAEFPGVTVSTEQFATEREAADFIFENTEKWGNALAVRVGDSWVIGGVAPC